jgi:flagellar protein FliL
MSTATADVASPKAGGKKKLLIIVLVAVLVLAAGGVGALLLLKKKAAAADEEDLEGAESPAVHQRDPKVVPTFVPLDMFTVNLADRETERYAQIGIVLELDDAKVGDQIKAYMPAIRNNILMVLAHKTSQELLAREGKELLAFEVKREASRALGIELDEEPPVTATKTASASDAEADAAPKPKAKKRKKTGEPSPIRQVQFSNFIIQ